MYAAASHFVSQRERRRININPCTQRAWLCSRMCVRIQVHFRSICAILAKTSPLACVRVCVRVCVLQTTNARRASTTSGSSSRRSAEEQVARRRRTSQGGFLSCLSHARTHAWADARAVRNAITFVCWDSPSAIVRWEYMLVVTPDWPASFVCAQETSSCIWIKCQRKIHILFGLFACYCLERDETFWNLKTINCTSFVIRSY